MNIRSKLFGRAGGDGSPVVQTKQPKGADATEGLHTIKVQRHEARTSDTRDGDRHRLPDETITVSHGGHSYPVQLINLSGGGAMVTGSGFAPQLWDRVDLNLAEGGTVDCVVLWLKGDRVGLEFAHETRLDCPEEERNAVLRAVIDRSFATSPSDAEEAAEQPAEEPSMRAEENRAEMRHPLIWSGTIHYDHESTPVRLRNISASGALIECARPLPVGAEPLLDLGEAGTLFASVSWTCGDQVGLSFHQPFDLQDLARAKPQLAPAKWEKPAYLRDAANASPWEKHWQRLSLGELSQELDGFLKR